MKNKVALILGGSGHIGSAIADVMEKEGAIVCRHSRGKGEWAADLAKNNQARKLVEKVAKKYGKIDILVNAVSAPLKIDSFEKKKWADFLGQFNIQLKAILESVQAAAPHMKNQKNGKIINVISAIIFDQPMFGLSDYNAAKHAVLGLTKSLAKELGRFNITVNAVSPGFLRNSFTGVFPEKTAEIVAAQTPLGRLATEKDAANAVLFLASEKADFITGENIIVSGGSVME
jgi:NAD(P)-dependent dehydrogenase (short-subunit alcohol dehydrogenase family)